MRILPLIIAILIAGASGAHAQRGDGVAVVPDLSRSGLFDLRVEVEKRYGRTLGIIRSEFPDDYAALVANISATRWGGGDENSALFAVFGIMTELKKKYADRLLFAPGPNHAAMLGSLARFYVAVSEGEGPEVCGRFARDGSGVLFELGLSGKYAAALDQQSVDYFEAVVAAIETPEYAGGVRPDDWSAVVEAMNKAGAPQSFAGTISSGNPADPDLCPALAAMFVTSGVLNTPEGRRTRADFARNLAGY